MSMSEPAPEQMSREELEDEVGDLRDSVEFLKRELQSYEDAIFGDVSPGLVRANLDGQSLVEAVMEIQEQGVEKQQSGVSEVARSEMVEAHRKLVDWREGADSSLTQSEIRGVALFRQFIRNLDDDDSMTGVSSEYGKFKIKSDRAEWILDDAGLLPESGKSMAKKRAMKKLVQMSTVEDCDCSGNCDHALCHFHNDEQYILSVDREEWMDYVASVQSAIEGVEIDASQHGSATADDAGDQPDDAVADEFDRLAEATREDEVANTVVSGSEESVLAGGETPDQDT